MKFQKKATTSSDHERIHPRDRANFLTHFLFLWEFDVLYKRWKNKLTDKEILTPIRNQESEQLGNRLETHWTHEVHFSKKPSLTKAIVKTFGAKYFLYGTMYFFLDMTVTFLQPIYLTKLLSNEEVFISASVIAAMSFLRVFNTNFFLFELSNLGNQIRISCCTLLFRRVLKLKKFETENISLGRIINLLTGDVEKFDVAFRFMHFLWMAPLKTIVCFFFLCFYFGWSSSAGTGVAIIALIAQSYALIKIFVNRRKTTVLSDVRVSLMNEIVTKIQAVKMYTLEKNFQLSVANSRSLEVKRIVRTNFYRLFIYSVTLYLSTCCVFLSVFVSVLHTSDLKSYCVYVFSNIFELLNNTISLFVSAVANVSDMKVSIQRMQEVLLTDSENFRSRSLFKLRANSQDGKEIVIKNATPGLNIMSLNNFTATSSKLIAVVGPPGSGKSTLLQVILKEVDLVEGEITVGGTISYASQEPWIFPATVRENILFGEEMDEEKYRKVVQMCALQQDLSLFSHSDNTCVGERGVRLSGGQKARINLARAVYRDADIYLLDDPFSALDSTVANHVFNDCILEYLKDKCVVLVTHQIQYLENADRIYVLNNGTIADSGKYEDLKDLIGRSVEKSMEKTEIETELKTEEKEVFLEVGEDTSATRNPYKCYFITYAKWTLTSLFLFLFVIAEIMICVNSYILSIWVNKKQNSTFTLSGPEVYFFYVYSSVTITIIILTSFCVVALTRHCYIASTKLHNGLFSRLLNGSMTFFNNQSSGRILNRFSRDIGIIDEMIPQNIFEFLKSFLVVIGACVMISVFNYWMIAPAIAMVILLYIYMLVFMPGVNYLKKKEKSGTSPIATHISSSLQGLVTIRASKAQQFIQRRFDQCQDEHSSVYYLFQALYFSYAFWVDLTAALYSAVVTFCFLYFQKTHLIGDVGLVITQSLMMLGRLQYGMKVWTDVDAQMTSVERVADYTALTEERDEGKFVLPGSWPEEGKIIFDSVSMRFSPDQAPVLKNVTFTVKPGERIGIVGRTGAGKSSLVSVLFRLFDCEGNIYIDGVDTKILPLKTLRSKISIIPQEPVLIKGTLRKNLDLFDQFPDSELWSALEDVEMKNLVSNLSSGLESVILEGGLNFSLGQRQLLCLARVILKQSKIVVLDEATANIDLKTDQLIQKTLRRKFGSSTVISVAHRLETLKDFDKILVMDCGQIVEYSSTEEVLNNRLLHTL